MAKENEKFGPSGYMFFHQVVREFVNLFLQLTFVIVTHRIEKFPICHSFDFLAVTVLLTIKKLKIAFLTSFTTAKFLNYQL